jgi:hypothetical protein
LDLSGIAAATPTGCLVGSDEGFHLQAGKIHPSTQRIEAGQQIALPLPHGGGKSPETDIEGVAFCKDLGVYYATGSHGLGKKKGDFQASRNVIYRLPIASGNGEVRPAAIHRTSLLPSLEQTPEIKPFLRKPLQQNGFNIEGLACSKGRLFFGLRGPNLNGKALVIEFEADKLFDANPSAATVHQLDLGAGKGIREIVAIDGGFLVLAGNASAEPSKKFPQSEAPAPDKWFTLWFWGGKADSLVRLGDLPQTGGKAEALLVLAESPTQVDVLVIHDGIADGGPILVRLHRESAGAGSAIHPGR